MGAVNFFKFDFRRSKYLFLISVVLFAPLGAMMGYTMESTLGIFSYMALVVVVTPTSLFTYELKNECGFDGLLPAKDRDKVFGRYMIGALSILFELTLGIVICIVMSTFTDLKIADLGVVSMTFMAVTLIYLSIAMVAYYLIGRNLNPRIRSSIIMLPCIILWFAINSIISVLTEEEAVGLILRVMENKEVVSALALVIGLAMYVISSLISTQIVKKKDYR
ncbi:MAG: hypothetical protein HFG29_06680 [Eubacterium sp.]|nr:hypothetical protein [Eubacterium sp.]